ncbi:hypothetical protein ACFPRL_01695 [Pseudoclavibacter helvolus]
MLPQAEHHQVLRMSEPERFEDGAIERDDAPARGGECEAELLVEREEVHGCRLTEIAVCANS